MGIKKNRVSSYFKMKKEALEKNKVADYSKIKEKTIKKNRITRHFERGKGIKDINKQKHI